MEVVEGFWWLVVGVGGYSTLLEIFRGCRECWMLLGVVWLLEVTGGVGVVVGFRGCWMV